MTTWTSEELDAIGDAQELRIAALRPGAQVTTLRLVPRG